MSTASSAIAQRRERGAVRPGGVAHEAVNVGDVERMLSAVGGGVLAAYGMARGDGIGLLVAAGGGALLYRGLTGHCHLYGALGINTSDESHSPVASVKAGAGRSQFSTHISPPMPTTRNEMKLSHWFVKLVGLMTMR